MRKPVPSSRPTGRMAAKRAFAAAFASVLLMTPATRAVEAVPVGTDFRQDQNMSGGPPPTVVWDGALNANNSIYFEGMSVPHRVIFASVATTEGDHHTLTFTHDASKNGIHAYDFLTSWAQAKQAGGGIPPSIPTIDLMGNLLGACAGVCPPLSTGSNCACGGAISQGATTCSCQALLFGPNHAVVPAPDNMGSVAGDDVQARANAYELVFGNRAIDLYGDQPILNATLTFDGYTGSPSEAIANYTLAWTSRSSSILVLFAVHLAAGVDPLVAGIGYGAGRGAASIRGAPYHVSLGALDGSPAGGGQTQNNGTGVFIPPPSCILECGNQTVCTGGSARCCADGVGGVPPYTFTWTRPDQSTFVGRCIDISNAQPGDAGTYSLVVSDSRSPPQASAPCTFVLTVASRPTATASAGAGGPNKCQAESGPTCFAPMNGSGTGGTPSWSVVSEPSPGCVSFAGDGPASFTPTVCFASGCTGQATVRLTVTGSGTCAGASASADVTLEVTPRPTASVSAPGGTQKCRDAADATCFELDAGGSLNAGAFVWTVVEQSTTPADCPITFAPDTHSVITNACFAQGCFGTAVVRLSAFGSGACADTAATADVTLTVAEMPTCAINPSPACVGDEICATPCDGVGDPDTHLYLWSPTGETTRCITPAEPGVYSVRILDESRSNREECFVTVNALPTAEATAGDDGGQQCQSDDGATCFAPLSGGGSGGSPSWSVVSEPMPGCVSFIGGDTFTPTVCFAAGCTGPATVRLTVTGTAPCGDRTATADVSLTVTPRPNVSVSAGADGGAECQADEGPTCFAPLNGSATNFSTATWSVVDQPSPDCVSFDDIHSLTPVVCFAEGCTGQATLRLTVTGSGVCEAEATAAAEITLSVTSPPTASATAGGDGGLRCQAAQGRTCFAPLNGSGSNGTPTWSVESEPSPGCVSFDDIHSLNPVACFAAGCTGPATVRLTVTGEGGCANTSASALVPLTVLSGPTARAAAGGDGSAKCQNPGSPTCFGPLNGSGENGTPSWSIISEPSPGCVSFEGDGAASFTPTVCFAAGCVGSATVRLTVSGAGLCSGSSASANLTLTVVAPPTATVAAGADGGVAQQPSDGGPTCFTPLNGGGSGGTPSWSVVEQPTPGCVSFTNAGTFAPTVCFAAGCVGQATVRLTVTGTGPCGGETAMADIVLAVISSPPPPNPAGACCLPDGSCRSLVRTDCELLGGTWQGAATACADVTCPRPCEPRITGLNILMSLIWKAPVCGVGCGAAVIASLIGLTALRTRRRRRRT